MTKYVVLRENETGWENAGTTEAASADAGIRTIAETAQGGETFVAIPARSWKPRTVTVETQTKVIFGSDT